MKYNIKSLLALMLVMSASLYASAQTVSQKQDKNTKSTEIIKKKKNDKKPPVKKSAVGDSSPYSRYMTQPNPNQTKTK